MIAIKIIGGIACIALVVVVIGVYIFVRNASDDERDH